jgi:UDP-2,3-diacylglucosamine hydrolase
MKNTSTLGIIAGTGRLPLQLIEACKSAGRDVFVLAFEESADSAVIAAAPHAIVPMGAISEALAHLRKAKVKELVMAGRVQRPTLTMLKPDLAAAKLIARMGGSLFAGDDALLKTVIAFLEEEGFTVVGAQHVLSSLVSEEGVLGNIQPDERSKADIAYGMEVAKRLGELDVGQAVVVENGYVLGLEAAEGTDALIARIAKLKQLGPNAGVLVKTKKLLQERRVDLPAIGPKTIENAHAAGLAGIAVEAEGSLILDREEVIKKANALGMFLVGMHHG